MTAVPQTNSMTLEEYFRLEEQSEIRHEYYRSEVFAMAGASREHNRIAIDLLTALNISLQGGPCEVFDSDMRVKVSETGLYTYPDISVTCGDSQFDENAPLDTLLNPIVLVEVLSESTEAYDRGGKAQQYRQISSLREYVLVSQNEPRIEVQRWQDDGPWTISDYAGVDAILELPSLDCAIPFAEIYRRVDFEPHRADA